MKTNQKLPVAVLEQVTGKRIVHRDIKEENILVQEIRYSLFSMTENPAECAFETISASMKKNDAIILFNNELYLANKEQQSVVKLTETKDNQYDYEWIRSAISESYPINDEIFRCIVNVTGISPYRINIIDYSLGGALGETNYRRRGSPGYIAPEIVSEKPANGIDPKVDVFALGIVLATLFHAKMFPDQPIFSDSDSYGERPHAHTRKAWQLPNLFQGIPGLSNAGKEKIRSILEGMLNNDPALRTRLVDAIEQLAGLQPDALYAKSFGFSSGFFPTINAPISSESGSSCKSCSSTTVETGSHSGSETELAAASGLMLAHVSSYTSIGY